MPSSNRENAHEHPKKKLYDLIFKVMKTQNEDLPSDKRNELIQSELISEYIKQDEFLKVLNQIDQLKN